MKKRVWMSTLLAVVAGSSYLITTLQSLHYSASDHFDEDEQTFFNRQELDRSAENKFIWFGHSNLLMRVVGIIMHRYQDAPA